MNGRYTPNEAALLSLLRKRRGRRMTTLEIVDVHYDGRLRPVHARRSVVTVLNSLIAKVEENGEPFAISKTPRAGPHPNQYWIERERGAAE